MNVTSQPSRSAAGSALRSSSARPARTVTPVQRIMAYSTGMLSTERSASSVQGPIAWNASLNATNWKPKRRALKTIRAACARADMRSPECR